MIAPELKDSVARLAQAGLGVVLVVAVAENGVIGRDNALPWRLKSDLGHFRALTLNKPVVMGRRTFESIGKPLPHRTNIVLTRDARFAPEGVVVVHDLAAALDRAADDCRARGQTEIMVIGGADLFARTMPFAARLELTEVRASPPGDVYFPVVAPEEWREIAREAMARGPQDEADCDFVTLVPRRRPDAGIAPGIA